MNTENTEVVNDIFDGELDSAWAEDEGTSLANEEPDAEPVTEEPVKEEQSSQEGQQRESEANQPELITLKNKILGDRQVTKEEYDAFAQKGYDYDRVKQERDQLRQQKSEFDPVVALVKRYADSMGKTLPEYLDYVREQELMAGGQTQQEAQRQISIEKREADLNARQTKLDAEENRRNSEAQKEQEHQARVSREVAAFRELYPDVKTVPQEVWDQVNKGVPLVTAYITHENKRLLAELAAERQNNANKQRSPGSLGGNTAPEMDEIDRLWSEDD